MDFINVPFLQSNAKHLKAARQNNFPFSLNDATIIKKPAQSRKQIWGQKALIGFRREYETGKMEKAPDTASWHCAVHPGGHRGRIRHLLLDSASCFALSDGSGYPYLF